MEKSGNLQELAEAFYEKRTEASFAPLYNRLRPGLIYSATNILKDADAAEDVVSVAFTKIWSKIGQYKIHWKFSTWAYRIVHNESMQYLRKASTTYHIIPGYESTITSDDVVYERDTHKDLIVEPDWEVNNTGDIREIIYDLVLREIKNLPDNYKDIMIDREINKMKYQDIATKYDIKINSVKTRIRRARTMLKNKVERITGEKVILHEE